MSDTPNGAAAPIATCCASASSILQRSPPALQCALSLADSDPCSRYRHAEAHDQRNASIERHALEGLPAALMLSAWLLASPLQALTAGLAMACAIFALNRASARITADLEGMHEGLAFAVCGLAVTVVMALLAPAPALVIVASLITAGISAFWPMRFHRWYANRPSAVEAVRTACRLPCSGCSRLPRN